MYLTLNASIDDEVDDSEMPMPSEDRRNDTRSLPLPTATVGDDDDDDDDDDVTPPSFFMATRR
jgi:hypothetical protein